MIRTRTPRREPQVGCNARSSYGTSHRGIAENVFAHCDWP